MILVATHLLLWAAFEPDRLSTEAVKTLKSSEAKKSSLRGPGRTGSGLVYCKWPDHDASSKLIATSSLHYVDR